MSGPNVSDSAPNFDLTSTEGVLLMLRDECIHTALALYLFPTIDERAKRDLLALASARATLARHDARALAISKAPLAELQKLQTELGLDFPLLHDDRAFLSTYGVNTDAEGPAGEPALYLVDREEKIVWKANPVAAVDATLPALLAAAKPLPKGFASYPKKVVNRVVGWWVSG